MTNKQRGGSSEQHAKAGRQSHGGQSKGTSSRSSSSRSEAARKGGEAVSRDREHMAEIGRKGGSS